jgi:hypothetical protein
MIFTKFDQVSKNWNCAWDLGDALDVWYICREGNLVEKRVISSGLESRRLNHIGTQAYLVDQVEKHRNQSQYIAFGQNS